MARIHLFEWEDFHWFPAFLRNYETDFLQFLANAAKIFLPVIPLIERGLSAAGSSQIVDIASGGGGGLYSLSRELKESYPHLKIVLTDYYPHVEAFRRLKKKLRVFDYVEESVDARNVPPDLQGLRTMFLSFHHFNPKDAQAILQNAVNSGHPIAIFEGQERSLSSLLAMFFSPITVLLTTPLIRPFTLGRLVFTYFIPIVPFIVWWDGIVSSLRTYSVQEMQELVSRLENRESFEWEMGKVKSGPAKVLYLVGTPKK